jgi:hypothetical protein
MARAVTWPAWLIALGFGALAYSSLGGSMWAHSHPEAAHQFAQYVGTWPASLGASLAVVGIVLALGPIRRGERWAATTTLVAIGIIAIPRMATDPRCLTSITSQHGCHTFVGASVAVILGSVAALFGRGRP